MYPKLSPREQQVLERIKLGMRGVDIAKQLLISEKTVQAHKSRICMKLEIPDIRKMLAELMRREIRDKELAHEMLMDMNDELDPGDCAP